jgi:ammonia channel protein AmtB
VDDRRHGSRPSLNAGSALAANQEAAMALLVTHLAAATAAVIWSVIVDKLVGKRAPVEIERAGLDIAEHHEQAYDLV